MTALQHRIVAEARDWIGTPYVHQSARKGAGTDCLGLIRGLWVSLYGAEPEPIPAYSMDWSEPQGEERLWEAALRHLLPRPLEQDIPADVILFRMRSGAVAKHLGIIGQTGAHPTFIHAYSRHGVVESALSLPWRRRIVARFSFPEEGF
ncbi:C40 family peptidase [Roseobacter sinensis]|uniref:Peptidase n=1 Tax=Roseobacter sinensis TaxID=2931391 RepID=A0ABT3BC33_9RHOB|nr:peptidase [Roseobacter sp. WL0113]MCV3271128.1 peptidase [Roseobacter sp. WL0113]